MSDVLYKRGLLPWFEPVTVHNFASWLSWLAMTGSTLMFWLAALIGNSRLLLALFLCVIPTICLVCRDRIWLALGKQLQRATNECLPVASNILAEVRGTSEHSRNTLWLLAHYDSKSQRPSMAVRMTAAVVFLLTAPALLLSILWDIPLLWIGLLLTSASLAALLLNLPEGNASPGALDNGAAVGVLLALAGLFRRHPPRNLTLRFVFTAAEENGLLGAFSLLRQHQRDLQEGAHLLVNLDTIGCSSTLHLFGTARSKLLRIVQDVGRRAGVRLKNGWLPPVLMMDHQVFSAEGLDSLSLSSLCRKTRFIHSRHDHLGLIDIGVLRGICDFFEQLVRELDSKSW
ncbi:MAG: M28 family peptidase [Deltaproteobacteria bacterium]|nr:M28 family peptidase [Deltaproteobacteria bacterium]MBW2071963.1 M28 family peptidase [Deltaproteobacteria bacterium]